MKKIFLFIFLFILVIPVSVFALSEDDGWCCIKNSNTGSTCQPILPVEAFTCDDFKPSPCTQTSVCKIGCCTDSEHGTCVEGSKRYSCEEDDNQWKDSPTCEISGCQKGCCSIGGEYFLSTRYECTKVAESYGPEVYGEWNEDSINEAECISQKQSERLGACVYTIGFVVECEFMKGTDCNTRYGEDLLSFNEDFLCTHEGIKEMGVDCERQDHTGCVAGLEDVYWFDSCGNRENVYEGEGNLNSWNDGKVKDTPSCAHPNNYDCGNCNSYNGYLCGEYKSEDITEDMLGYTCKDMNCYDDVPTNGLSVNEDLLLFSGDREENDPVRLNGESWCLFDSYSGYGKDAVGSEHYMATCLNGEVKIALGQTMRQQVCVEDLIETVFNGEDYLFSKADWVDNTNDALLEYCRTFNDDAITEQENCENNRLCSWISGVCVGAVPMGRDLLLAVDPEAEGYTSDVEDAMTANVECNEKRLRGDLQINFQRSYDSDSGESSATSINWWLSRNNVCVSLGDCGSYINFVGEGDASGGYTWSDKPSNKLIGENSWKLYNEYFWRGNYEKGYFDREGDFSTNYLFKFPLNGMDFGLPRNFADSYFGQRFVVIKEEDFKQYTVDTGEGTLLPWEQYNDWWHDTFSDWTDDDPSGTVHFQCGAWQPPSGSENCHECHEDPLGRPCTEYKCESLGDLCQFFDGFEEQPEEGDEGYGEVPIDFGVGKTYTSAPYCGKIDCNYDINEPFVIFENSSVESDLENTIKLIQKGDKGGEIKVNDGDNGCIDENDLMRLVLNFDKPTKCKSSYKRSTTPGYDNLDETWLFSNEGDLFTINNSFDIIEESVDGIEWAQLYDNGERAKITLYVSCEGKCPNTDMSIPYQFEFCLNNIDETPPGFNKIEPLSESYVGNEQTEINVTIWINEKAECRYNKDVDITFDQMAIENNFIGTGRDIDGYSYDATLKNLLSDAENLFYFRCKDRPDEADEDRNENAMGIEYKIHPSQGPLEIVSTSPVGTIKGISLLFDLELGVITAGGAKGDGVSNCTFLYNSQYEYFAQSDSNQHSQTWSFFPGQHNMKIRCIDEAGNIALGEINFTLEVDKQAPIVTRAFELGGKLKIKTDELAKCYANYTSCNFDIFNEDDSLNGGKSMTTAYSISHSINWDSSKTYYIKCKDILDTSNSGCGIIVRPGAV